MAEEDKKNNVLITTLIAALAGGGSGVGVRYVSPPVDAGTRVHKEQIAIIERDLAVLKTEVRELRKLQMRVTDLERWMWKGGG